MFSSSEMIHFVFANKEDEVYYCGGLLQLDLDQYLWMQLHKANYKAVYFLKKAEGQTFSIQTYGDKNNSPFAPKQSFFKWFTNSETDEKQQGDWLRDRLAEKAAIVCPIGDFCDIMSSAAWQSTVRSLAGMRNQEGRGILVLTAPVTVDGSQELLLRSPVFDSDHLNEAAVIEARNGGERPLYPAIKDVKKDSVVFLNKDGCWDMVQNLLRCLSFERGQFLSKDELEAAAKYLARYLNCAALRKAEPLFDGGRLEWNFHYKKLHDHLRNDEVWNRLLSQSLRAKETGSLENYKWENSSGILWENGSYAQRCLELTTPEGDSTTEECRAILEIIQKKVRAPKNKMDNPHIVDEFQELFPELSTAQSNGYSDAYRRTLYTIQFCVQWIHVEETRETDILQIIENLKRIIRSSITYATDREHQEEDRIGFGSRMSQANQGLQEQRVQALKNWELARTRLENMIQTSILLLPLNANSGEIRELLDDLDRQVDEVEEMEKQKREMEQKVSEPVKKEPEPTQEEEEDLDSWEAMLNPRPPD